MNHRYVASGPTYIDFAGMLPPESRWTFTERVSCHTRVLKLEWFSPHQDIVLESITCGQFENLVQPVDPALFMHGVVVDMASLKPDQDMSITLFSRSKRRRGFACRFYVYELVPVENV